DAAPAPVSTRVRRFWRSLVTGRASSSHAQQELGLQPVPDRRFWKFPARIPLTKGVVVARSTPRKKKRKGGKSHRRRKPRTHADSSAAETGPSSSNTEGTSSNASPPNAQVDPSTSSNAAPATRTSSYAQSTTGPDDSWDDLDCSEKCVDYFCFGPRQNRERFRPWKNKSREVMETEERSKNGKKRSPRRHSKTE
ncbi:hypothetical protein PAXRUDRAFT_114201, partial [Paxillus rubicundulus Ve08.2h10]